VPGVELIWVRTLGLWPLLDQVFRPCFLLWWWEPCVGHACHGPGAYSLYLNSRQVLNGGSFVAAVIGNYWVFKIRIVDNQCKRRALQPATDEAFIRTPAFCIIPAHNEEGLFTRRLDQFWQMNINTNGLLWWQTGAQTKRPPWLGRQVRKFGSVQRAGGQTACPSVAFGRLLAEATTGFVMILDADNILGPGPGGVAKGLQQYDAVQLRILPQNPIQVSRLPGMQYKMPGAMPGKPAGHV